MATALKKYTTKNGRNIPYLYQDADGGFWVRKFVSGKDRIKSLGTVVENIAVSKTHSAITELIDKATNEQSKPKTNLLFRDFYDKMLEQKLSIDTKPATMTRIRSTWKNSVEPFWGNLTPKEINKDLGVKFIEWHRRVRPGVFLANVYKVVGGVLNVMVNDGAILPTQRPELLLPKTEQKHLKIQKGAFVTAVEFNSICAHFDERYVLLLNLAYYLGMRQMELGALKCSSVVKRDDRVFIDLSAHDTKTGLPRIVPVPKQFEAQLLDRKSKSSRFVFESPTDPEKHISQKMIFQMWKAAKARAMIPPGHRIRFHDLRHTRATILVKETTNPLLIAAFLGMSIDMLQKRYFHLKPEDLLALLKEEIK